MVQKYVILFVNVIFIFFSDNHFAIFYLPSIEDEIIVWNRWACLYCRAEGVVMVILSITVIDSFIALGKAFWPELLHCSRVSPYTHMDISSQGTGTGIRG